MKPALVGRVTCRANPGISDLGGQIIPESSMPCKRKPAVFLDGGAMPGCASPLPAGLAT